MNIEDAFIQDQGIFFPRHPLVHRNAEYNEQGFELLPQMQREHFWYRGRHRLLLNVLQQEISKQSSSQDPRRAMDMGGGCGGWIEYLHHNAPGLFSQLALGDSSKQALAIAGPIVGSFAARYQIDLLNLPWREEWDVVFLLDVLEHIPDQVSALRQIVNSLRPGGLLFVTTPALKLFWTYNDDLVQHQRRYCRKDFQVLARQLGLELLRTDYFMFLLSPLLWINRLCVRPPASATPAQLQAHVIQTHQTPTRWLNQLLTHVFLLEAAMVNTFRFPWGTSILAVFRR